MRALGGPSLRLPGRARDRVGKILGGLGSSVRISAAADIEIAGEDRAADPRVVLLLRWDGGTLKVRFRVAPLGLQGPHVRPGVGDVTVAATVDGRPLRTRRDLDAERRSMDTLLDGCPTLAGLPTRAADALVLGSLPSKLPSHPSWPILARGPTGRRGVPCKQHDEPLSGPRPFAYGQLREEGAQGK